jgi:hypothetical protein
MRSTGKGLKPEARKAETEEKAGCFDGTSAHFTHSHPVEGDNRQIEIDR